MGKQRIEEVMNNPVRIELEDPSTYPPEGEVVDTWIHDRDGKRNFQPLFLYRGRFCFPDRSGYVYYVPTHWRRIENKGQFSAADVEEIGNELRKVGKKR